MAVCHDLPVPVPNYTRCIWEPSQVRLFRGWSSQSPTSILLQAEFAEALRNTMTIDRRSAYSVFPELLELHQNRAVRPEVSKIHRGVRHCLVLGSLYNQHLLNMDYQFPFSPRYHGSL
jgi:hypothetical protein